MPPISTAESPLRPSARDKQGRARRRSILRWIKRGLLISLGGTIVTLVVLAWLPDPTVVDVATVQRKSLETEIAEDGKTRVRDRYAVTAPMSGELLRIELDPGATVHSGQVLATIVPPTPQLLDTRTRDEARARLSLAAAHERTARAVIAKAMAARDAALRDAARAALLVQRGAITAAEDERIQLAAEIARRDVSTAEAQRSAAVAEADAARAILGMTPTTTTPATSLVTSPASGRVLRVFRDSAGPIAAGTPLLEIGDLSTLELVIDVLSSEAARVTPGMHVEMERWGGDGLLKAAVVRVEPSAFTRMSALGVEEQRVRVIAVVEKPPATLGDGFGVTTRIVTWRGDNVLTVPASAVFRYRGEWAVYTVDGDRARLRTIAIQHRGRIDVEITGIDEGTRVILHPGDSVRDGATVAVR
jgi:HlyD family secretion protein